MFGPGWWSEFAVCITAISSLIIPFTIAEQCQPTQYFVNNEVIYTNQSTGQSTPKVSDLCVLFAPECFCSGMSCLGLLFDGDTASTDNGNIDLQKFWAFNGSSDGNIRIVLPGNTPVIVIVLYFYNSPNELIGLPDIEITDNPAAKNVSFDLTDINDLSQTDSQVRSVSLSLTQGVSDLNIWFLFPGNSKYILISEAVLNTGSSPFDPVEFLNVPSSEMTFGPDNLQSSVSLSCTVTNCGSFEWQWRHNGSPVDTSQLQIWTADATRTSTLVVDRLRYTDTGTYTCDVQFSTMSSTYSRSIVLNLVVEVDALTAVVSGEEGGDSVLSCEMYGYLTEGIEWTKDGWQNLSGASYVISNSSGDRVGQDGGENTTSSVISELRIHQLQQQDNGTYVCRAAGTTVQDEVELTINNPATVLPTPSSVVTALQDTSSTPVMSSTVPEGTSSIISAVVVPVIALILLIATASILTVIICTKKRTAQLHHTPHDAQCTRQLSVQRNPLYESSKETDLIAMHSEVGSAELQYIPVYSVVKKKLPATSHLYTSAEARKEDVPVKHTRRKKQRSPFEKHAGDIPSQPKPTSQQAEGTACLHESHNVEASATALENTDPIAQYSTVTAPFDPELTGTYSEYDTTTSHFDSVYSKADAVFTQDGLINNGHNEAEEEVTQDEQMVIPIYAEPQSSMKTRVVTESNDSHFNILKHLGVGQFGEVLLAETIGLSLKDLGLSDTEGNKHISVLVAIKRLRENSHDTTRKSFNKEMKFMSQLSHTNVVSLLAVKTTGEPFMVLEYMENGDLNQFLLKHTFSRKHPPISPSGISSPILLSMVVQIASGMTYLASLNFIHRDLDIRNCLVKSKYHIKIADFGLSRSLYDSAYYRVKGRARMPIRWMAPECFYGRFSEKSDVWAFGVVVWEIYSLARLLPYDEKSDDEIMEDIAKGIELDTLAKPKYCPQNVYEIIMNGCWERRSMERATFERIQSLLTSM